MPQLPGMVPQKLQPFELFTRPQVTFFTHTTEERSFVRTRGKPIKGLPWTKPQVTGGGAAAFLATDLREGNCPSDISRPT